MQNVTVIGSGTMGNGIAHVFAQNGFNVVVVDIDDARIKRGIETISGNLDGQVKKEPITPKEKEDTLERITGNTDMRSVVPGADLIIEAASEDMGIKSEIFRSLDQNARPEAILATNTS